MAKRRTWRWVTRDPDSNLLVVVWRSSEKPQLDVDRLWGNVDQDSMFPICADEFKCLTDLIIPTDRPVKVEFSARIVE